MASLGPMPLTVMSFWKKLLLFPPQKTEERQGIFAHVSVNVQRDLAARRRQFGKCGHSDGDVIADATRLDDGLVGFWR